jgi:hypothetical protein
MKTTWVLGLVAMTGVALPSLATRTGGSPVGLDPRAAIFLRHGCNDCHAIYAFRVKALHDVGPDLSYAYTNVPTRYGVDLETFLDRPTGMMRLMLTSQIRLSPVDRDSIVQTLKGLYAQRVALGQ